MSNQNWRDIRTCSPPQRLYLDALTCRGQFSQKFPSRTRSDGGSVKTPHVLGGGSGFGGKSHVIRTAAVELNADLAGHGITAPWGAIFCKTYTELADRQIMRVRKELEQGLGLGKVRKTTIGGLFFEFHDKNLGGFYFRNVGSDPDSRKGVEYDWIQVDELTQFTREDIDAVLYTLRSGRPLPYKAFGAATNPDGPGHGWVKSWWIEKDFMEEEELIEQGLIDPDDFVFVPFMPTDNPMFDKTIQARLMGFKDPMLVKARWLGIWDLGEGTRFSLFRRNLHIFEQSELEECYGGYTQMARLLQDQDVMYIYGSLDYGTDSTSASAFYLHAVDHKGRTWTFHETYLAGMFLNDQAKVIREVCEQYKVIRIYCDPALAGRDSDGISRLQKFRLQGVFLTPGINDRIEGWSTMDGYLWWSMAGGELLHAPLWRIHSSCRHLIKFLANAPRDATRPEDVSHTFKEDHAGDSARYFFHSYFKRPPVAVHNNYGGGLSVRERIEARRTKTNADPIQW